MPGGDIYQGQIAFGQAPFSVDVTLDDSGGTLLTYTTKSANHQIVIQKIVLSIHTQANTKKFTVTSSTGNPVNIAGHTSLTAAAGVPSVVEWDFGPHGVALAVAASMVVATTATSSILGVAHIEGYEKLVGAVAAGSTN